MSDELKVLGDITVYAALALALIYLLGIFRQGFPYRILTIYLVVIGLIQYGAFYVGRGHLGKANLYYSHFYYLSQFVLLSLFYSHLLKKKWLYIPIVVMMTYAAYGFITEPQSFYRFNAMGMTISHVLIVVYSILYLYKSVSEKGAFVIASSGMFIYLLSSTLIFTVRGLGVNLNISEEAILILSDLNKVLYLFMLLMLLLEWFKNYNLIKGFFVKSFTKT